MELEVVRLKLLRVPATPFHAWNMSLLNMTKEVSHNFTVAFDVGYL